MNRKNKMILIVISVVAVLVVMHFSLNYFVPLIKNMHNGMF